MTHNSMMAEKVGLVTKGWIDSYNPDTNTLFVKLNNSPITSRNPAHPVPAPHSLFYNNGLFIGSLPVPGTPVAIAQGSGGQYYYVSALIENLPKLPDLESNTLLISANATTKITLDTSYNVKIGSDANGIHLNTDYGYFSHNYDSQNSFTQASRHVIGAVKRDLTINTNFDQNTKLENDDYDPYYTVIGLDPSTTATSILSSPSKNPPFVEDREMVYEFEYDTDITDDLTESSFYGPKGAANIVPPPTLNRRTSRADTLSLTLAAPNYLMETIKGTVVDIFGNILDLNRNPIPVGQGQNTINANISKNAAKSFLSIKELERKSVAYHFEINARKDLTGQNGQISLPDINSNADYARNRSRFFFDVDKEGQFKLNVPASSEVGNIPLLARYENYSTFSTDDNSNPNQLTFIKDKKDIFLDSFAAPIATPTTDIGFRFSDARGSIQLVDGSVANSAPLDRITSSDIGEPTHIMHGTVYHDILQTCYVNQNNAFIDYGYGGSVVPIDLSAITPLTNVVSNTIVTSGPKANSGGRSGSINLDGSLEFNIGANTIDRQSLWIDTAGGVVGNFGRDLNGRSAMLNMNGDVFMQVGGWGVTSDSRFQNVNNEHRGGTLDIRVIDDNGKASIVRFDNKGNVTIMSHGNMQIFASQSMTISANQNITIDCETLTLQERMVLKGTGGSI
jgi:hypothetical protein